MMRYWSLLDAKNTRFQSSYDKLMTCEMRKNAARQFTLRLDSCTESVWFQQAGGGIYTLKATFVEAQQIAWTKARVVLGHHLHH